MELITCYACCVYPLGPHLGECIPCYPSAILIVANTCWWSPSQPHKIVARAWLTVLTAPHLSSTSHYRGLSRGRSLGTDSVTAWGVSSKHFVFQVCEFKDFFGAYYHTTSLFFFKITLFIYLFLAALGLRCCMQASSSCGERGLLFVAVHRLLIAVASLVAENGLSVHWLQ